MVCRRGGTGEAAVATVEQVALRRGGLQRAPEFTLLSPDQGLEHAVSDIALGEGLRASGKLEVEDLLLDVGG